MRIWGALSVWLALLAVVPCQAQAAGLRLVTGMDYLPFAGPQLSDGGMATDLVMAAFAASGTAVEPVVFLPWKRGYQAVLDGEYDATFPYVDASEREETMIFSVPLYDTEIWPVFRADHMRPYTGPDSLAGLTLCQPVGYAQPIVLQKMIDSGVLHLVQPATMPLCERQLLAGRVDLLINSPGMFKTMVQPEWHDGPAPRLGDRPIADISLFVLASRTNPKATEIMAQFAAGISMLRADGRYQAIVQRHLGEPSTP